MSLFISVFVESNAESLGCDIDAADDEDDNFLVPDFRNAPDPDDIFALRWGKSFYMKNFPHFKRKTLE
eukprot:Em0001g880a